MRTKKELITEENKLEKLKRRSQDISEIIDRIREAPLQNDYIFKRTFTKTGTDILLRDFLEGVLKRKIIKVEIRNSEIPKEILNEKNEYTRY